MRKYENLYCKLFIDSELEFASIVEILINITSGDFMYRRTVKTSEAMIDVNYNCEFDKSGKLQKDGFLYYKFFLDIEPTAEVEQNKYISVVRKILKELEKKSIHCVAACDFEDVLFV